MPEKNDFIKMLRDQGVSNFDPVAFYKEANIETILEEQNKKLTKKQKKKMKKSKTALKIIADNKKRKEMALRKDEERKIKFFMDNLNGFDEMKDKLKQMVTNYGRIKLKVKFLQYCLDNNIELGIHLLFYSLSAEEKPEDKDLLDMYRNILGTYKKKYKNTNLVKLQMTDMSSYLPPLDPFKNKVMKLDDWQVKVFKMIEENKNILIVAPTSAGKTVCSTYCAVLGHKTLFVVPSDELARQVAGIFRNMDLNVGLITNNEYFMEEDFKVLIGTPYKLEEYLIINGYKDFKYVIYDEIQMLNGEEGNSFEKIIKLMDCPFLALSATIEHPKKLQTWLQKIKSSKVELITYHKRFIVQQRYLWQDKLVHLHPLSCVNLEYLSNPNFLKSEMSFTPRDSYDLYEKIKEQDIDVQSPNKFFNKTKWDQITLTETIGYENYLKEFMANLSETSPDIASNILKNYIINDELYNINLIKIIKTLLSKDMGPIIIFKLDPVLCQQLFIALVNGIEDAQNKKYPYHYDDLELEYENYSAYLSELEKVKSNLSIPKDKDPIDYITQQEKRIEAKYLEAIKTKYNKIISKRIKKINEDDNVSENKKKFYSRYYNFKLGKVLELENLRSIDKNRPHPEYMFNKLDISSNQMRDIRRTISRGLGKKIDWTHTFLKGIERGIVPYFRNMSTPFQLVVQSLYSQKIIPVVISDESLGYGINMPIRTAVILGKKDIEQVDTLIASQMSGRSGRRGIDNEGHIVYVGVNWRTILKGTYAPLEGKDPIDDQLSLPLYFKKLDKKEIVKLVRLTLTQYLNGEEPNLKREIKKIMNLVKKNDFSKRPSNALMSWSSRKFGINCFLIPLILRELKDCEDKFRLFKLFSCLFDDKAGRINDDSLDFIKASVDINDYKNLYNGNELLLVYKSRAITENVDQVINRLRVIGTVIAACYETCHLTKTLKNNLKNTFENIKSIVDKYKF